MGNTATIICGVRTEKESITVLQANGKVLEFSQKVRAAELMIGHPHHFLCNASAILSGERGKMLPPRAVLQRGNIYLLLPLPADRHSAATKSSFTNSKGDVRQQVRSSSDNARSTAPRTTTKFVISRQYLDKILSHSDSKMKEQKRAPAAPATKQTTAVKRKSTLSWTPALESIPEVAAR